MTTSTQQLRDLLVSHDVFDPFILAKALLDIIDQQQAAIDELRNVMLGHERRIADINRNISRLNKVHGA